MQKLRSIITGYLALAFSINPYGSASQGGRFAHLTMPGFWGKTAAPSPYLCRV